MRPDPSHLTDELARHGVTTWHVEHGGKHPRLVFQWQGRTLAYVFPASPSDSYRGQVAGVTGLRRIMGVRRAKEGGGGKRRRAVRVQALPPLPEGFLTPADPWERLKELRDA